MQWTVLMSPGSSQSIRAWENSLLPPIGAPRIPPEQPFSGIILLGYKLREFDKLDMAANGLFNDILGQIAHAMGLNWRNYEDAEGANAQTWRK